MRTPWIGAANVLTDARQKRRGVHLDRGAPVSSATRMPGARRSLGRQTAEPAQRGSALRAASNARRALLPSPGDARGTSPSICCAAVHALARRRRGKQPLRQVLDVGDGSLLVAPIHVLR
jgi:hypothetical protein